MVAAVARSPHFPRRLEWIIIKSETGDIINSAEQERHPKSWFPNLYFDVCKLFGTNWGLRGDPKYPGPTQGIGRRTPGYRDLTHQHNFYVSPGHSRSQSQQAKCGGPEPFFCAVWGCESMGKIDWKPSIQGDWIQVSQSKGPTCWSNPDCNPICIHSTP